jgi:hypothetical protein
MDWVVGATTLICVELMIRRKWYAWCFSIGNQFVWLTYIVVAEQWGLLPLNLVLFVQNTRGLIAWRREHRKVNSHVEHRMPDKTTPSSG